MPDETPASSSTINFGTAAYKNAVTGLIITSIKFGSNAQSAEAMDEDGNIIQVDMYGKKQTVNIEGTVSSGTTLALVAGGTITIDGVAYTIESVEVTNTNTGHTNASITASAPVAPASGT
ncbi:MAG: hypothetical protein IJH79_15355 [Lentisphaeria bacterium]|nr:hypothetical protein [Lentisphaeria bacterium]